MESPWSLRPAYPAIRGKGGGTPRLPILPCSLLATLIWQHMGGSEPGSMESMEAGCDLAQKRQGRHGMPPLAFLPAAIERTRRRSSANCHRSKKTETCDS